MHYESMHGAHYVVPGKECNIQIMLIHTSEITTSKYKFLFLLFFSNHDYCCEWNLKYYVLFFKSPDPFPYELERLPERLFISLIEDFIDVQQTTAFNSFQYRLAFDSVVNLCVFMFIKAYCSKNNWIKEFTRFY